MSIEALKKTLKSKQDKISADSEKVERIVSQLADTTAYKSIPTYNVQQKKWYYSSFKNRKDWIVFLRQQFKEVGKYKLCNTHLWNEKGMTYMKNQVYTKFPKNSKAYNDFWKAEGKKCNTGIIYESEGIEHFVSGYYYFYLNYCPILVKHEKNKEMIPEIWDLDYHTFLYLERSFAENKFAACNKRRQTGWSYKMAAIAICDLWFRKKQKIKVWSSKEVYINDYWSICGSYRKHLIKNTGWGRQFWKSAAKDMEWHMIWKAQEAGRDIDIGRDNRLIGINTRVESTALVGGFNTLVIGEESGVDKSLLKNLGFVSPSLKQNELITGKLIIGGSVGELKDCAGLRQITYKPRDYDFLAIPDLENPALERVLFIPMQWNYIHVIKDDEDDSIVLGYVKCYDKDGNSDIPLALKYLTELREKKKKQSPESYTLYCSQNPMTLDELYQGREDNRFDIPLLSRQFLRLEENFKPVTIEIFEQNGRYSPVITPKQLVTEFPTKPSSYKEGGIVMLEPPMENPKPFIYYAGVDPVKELKGGYGSSLMSCYIYKNYYEENNELKGGYPVAYYTGRHFDDKETFENVYKLIKLYNAHAAIENDQDSFINYIRQKNDESIILRRSQVPILKDLVPNSQISSDEYGIRMNTGGKKSRVFEYALNKIKEYTEEILDINKDDFGNDIVRYGVERIQDPMLLTELIEYSDEGGNYDRIVAFGLALLTAKSYEANKVMQRFVTQNQNPHIYSGVTKNNLTSTITYNSAISSYNPLRNKLTKTTFNPFIKTK